MFLAEMNTEYHLCTRRMNGFTGTRDLSLQKWGSIQDEVPNLNSPFYYGIGPRLLPTRCSFQLTLQSGGSRVLKFWALKWKQKCERTFQKASCKGTYSVFSSPPFCFLEADVMSLWQDYRSLGAGGRGLEIVVQVLKESSVTDLRVHNLHYSQMARGFLGFQSPFFYRNLGTSAWIKEQLWVTTQNHTQSCCYHSKEQEGFRPLLTSEWHVASTVPILSKNFNPKVHTQP